MSDRLKSMRRILAVQAQRKQLAEWKLAAIDYRKASIAAARAELDGFIDRTDLTGPLAAEALRQTRRLAEREARTDLERASQQTVAQSAQRQHRLAERVTEAAEAEARVRDERRSLEQLIEAAVALHGRRETGDA